MKKQGLLIYLLVAGLSFALVLSACTKKTGAPGDGAVSGVSSDVAAIAEARGLTPQDIAAAVKTYTPSGKHDDYVMFASGGHSGQVFVVGMPSMRMLKEIAVFTPEPWQGYGYGATETMETLAGGQVNGKDVLWADTHHPALSETNGDYDGETLFINDKANGRVAVIDLRDFETKQIVKNPLAINDHGLFVTPNTDYVIEGTQYATPLEWEYGSKEEYQEKYRGSITFWKYDRETRRIDDSKSWAIELPPYWQDLCDAGKAVSDGWAFCNSFNTEMALGMENPGEPPFEAGASQRDMDYLHIFNWKKAAELVAAGQVDNSRGFPMITLQTAIDEGILFFIGEPKSPHGVDVTPNGDYIVISGKLDPHVTIYSWAKMQAAIEAGQFERDPYGVPILPFDKVMEAQVEVGLGPLHTQFDDQGYAYTSLFLDSAVARWSLGPPYRQDGWKLEATLPVQYNIGHLAAAGGDTAHPDGKYLVALNKWAIDRYTSVGPLLPQNFQLIDIAQPGNALQLLYDMPVGSGEPHYAQIIKADKLKPWDVYPEVGWDPGKQAKSDKAVKLGEERVERNGTTVEIYQSVIRSHYTPENIEVNKGDHVIWHLTNVETAKDATHGFAMPGYNISLSLEPGETVTIDFIADQDGTFTYYCTEFCSALHLEMTGYFRVKP